MTRRMDRLAFPALVLLSTLPSLIGGWAITVVDDVPEYAVAGRPLTLTFTVRQHGFRPIDGLSPRIEALCSELRTYRAVRHGSVPGRYAATVTLPRPGEWSITIHSGFGSSRTTLVPLTAIAPGSPPPAALTQAEEGRRLFAAKGCFTCHVELRAGPDLFTKRYTAEYVTQVVADPDRVFAGRQRPAPMPKLELSPREIAAVAAYVSGNRRVALR